MPQTPRNIQTGYTATDFWDNWNSVNPRIATFIKITPQTFWSGVSVLGFTTNTRDMTMPGHSGITFRSTVGIVPTFIEQILGEAAQMEITGIYQTGIFERADVLAGKWNFAQVEVFSASWDDGTMDGGDDRRDYGELVDGIFKLGEFKDYGTYFTAELRGLLSLFSKDTFKGVQRHCRVKEFRDAECGHTAETVSIGGDDYDVEQTGLIVVDANEQFVSCDFTNWSGTTEPPETLFSNGKITMTSGANAGVSREIAITGNIFPGFQIELKRPFPFVPEIDDTFDLVAGCTRTLEDCMKYENIVNFRGEPYVPGIETANRILSSN